MMSVLITVASRHRSTAEIGEAIAGALREAGFATGIDSRVADVMSRDVVTVLADATLGDAAELMAGFGISGLPVVDDDGLLTGVLSETDLVRLRSGAPPTRSWHALLVRDLMTTPAIVVQSEAPVHEAAGVMANRRIHRLFVVDRDGVPVGVLSESDVVAEIADLDE